MSTTETNQNNNMKVDEAVFALLATLDETGDTDYVIHFKREVRGGVSRYVATGEHS